jgi:hypothetical protein
METGSLLSDALRSFDGRSHDPAKYDAAEANLLCAVGLLGSEGLDVGVGCTRLDEIAADVERIIYLKENYDQFLNNPGKFHNSHAFFCVVSMVSILKTKYRVCYNPKWAHVTPENEVPDEFGKDSRDQFIHAMLNGEGGTCGSMPVFIVAVGRRIGMPLKLVKACRHLFIRWDDPQGLWNCPDGKPNPSQGEVFNIEATGPDVHLISDEEYRCRWPLAIPDEYLKTGIYLKSMTPEEELSEFLAIRGYCLLRNERLAEGLAALRWSSRLAPHNLMRKAELDNLESRIEYVPQGSYYVNKPVQKLEHEKEYPVGPHWYQIDGGARVLIQILRPDHLARTNTFGQSAMNVGMSLQQRDVQLPNGDHARAEVPVHGAGQEMEAYWVELSSNEFALVHKPLTGAFAPLDPQLIGKPILPEPEHSSWRQPSPTRPDTAAGIHHRQWQALSHWEEIGIKRAIEQTNEELARAARVPPGMPPNLAPALGFVPTHGHLPRMPGKAISLPHLLT